MLEKVIFPKFASKCENIYSVGQNWVYMVIKLQRGQVRQYVGVGANIY